MSKGYALTREQEAMAYHLIKSGGPDGERAKEQFVFFNQKLVGSVARRYRDKGLTWEELLSAGNVGLLQAVNRFDPSLGYKFSTFAVPWIEGEIKQLFKTTHKRKMGDRAVMQTENGVPLEFSTDTQSEEVEELDRGVVNPPSEEGEEIDLAHPELQDDSTLADHVDLQEAVALDMEEEGGIGLNPAEARSEGIGSSAGCAEWDNLRGEDPSSDPKPAGGVAINFAADQSTGVMGVDADLIPALEQAIQRLEPRQAQVFAMHLGLLGHNQHTVAEIGAQFGFTTQRAQAIFKSAFAQLRNDPTLQLLFEQTI
jgi:RNA polymerase sigma factor (sigma-70 family)